MKKLRTYLNQYINKGALSNLDYLLLLFFPRWVYRKNASRINDIYFEEISYIKQQSLSPFQQIEINSFPIYDEKEVNILALKKELRAIDEHLEGVLIHGSYGSSDAIPYSDLDLLVILKDKAFDSHANLAEVGLILYKCQKHIFRLDPLQHHGWFILTEGMLKAYPNDYFPTILFDRGKWLLAPQTNLLIQFSEKELALNYPKSFQSLSSGLLKKLQRNYRPKTAFQIKSFLSEIMLLPLFYLQAKNSSVFHKKESFELAKQEFNEIDWYPIELASRIRMNWPNKMNFIQSFFLKSPHYILRRIGRNIPGNANKINDLPLSNQFFEDTLNLIQKMNENLKNKLHAAN